ncbi:MAG: HD domain-containing protein [Deltaproteobacteria bacterium]|nr:HD domain-containing protein [Deltaproteobacteria bacterium]
MVSRYRLMEIRKERLVEVSGNIKDYKDYDAYYLDSELYKFILYKPRGVDIDGIRVKNGKIPQKLYVSLSDRIHYASRHQQRYNAELKTVLKANNPVKSKRVLKKALDLSLTTPSPEILQHLGRTLDVIVEGYLANPEIVKNMIDIATKDYSTSAHSVNVMLYCLSYARAAGFSLEKLKLFGLIGLLHDVGKTRVPDNILKAPRKLNPDEFETITMHPDHGFGILSQTKLDRKIRTVALQHHERLDGSGYPKRPNQKDLLPESMALAIIDTYEALTNWRPYKYPIDPIKALHIIKKDVLRGRLDEEAFRTFAQSLVGSR